MDNQLINLKRKVGQYQEVLANTANYRQVWRESLREKIEKTLLDLTAAVGLTCEIEVRDEMDNLEAVVLSLGAVQSGMSQRVNAHIQRDLIKHNGDLIYQQLFNGKVMVLINYPFIEGYGQPREPKVIAIYRPEELQDPYFQRHLEELIQEVTLWEDYDDDEPHQRIGFQLNFGAGAPASPPPDAPAAT